jgi:hypothetical protein
MIRAKSIIVTLADGDRFHIGAWTTVTIRRCEATSPSDV